VRLYDVLLVLVAARAVMAYYRRRPSMLTPIVLALCALACVVLAVMATHAASHKTSAAPSSYRSASRPSSYRLASRLHEDVRHQRREEKNGQMRATDDKINASLRWGALETPDAPEERTTL
jgi:hypothetical protein